MTIIGLPFIVLSLLQSNIPPLHELFFLVLLGIIPWGIPDVLYTIGIKYVPVFRALILGLFDPVLTAVWTLLALGEYPSATAMIGCFVVTMAIVYQAYFEQRCQLKSSQQA